MQAHEGSSRSFFFSFVRSSLLQGKALEVLFVHGPSASGQHLSVLDGYSGMRLAASAQAARATDTQVDTDGRLSRPVVLSRLSQLTVGSS